MNGAIHARTVPESLHITIEAGKTERHYWRDMWRYRELFSFLAWRDILVRYKQTVIGFGWALIRPFLTMIVFVIVFSKLAKLPSDGVPYPILLRIARCESGLNPRASYSGHYGLFQFLPDTFRGGAQGMRTETGIAAHSYWNPADSSYVAGYLFAIGKAPSWGCLYQSPS